MRNASNTIGAAGSWRIDFGSIQRLILGATKPSADDDRHLVPCTGSRDAEGEEAGRAAVVQEFELIVPRWQTEEGDGTGMIREQRQRELVSKR